MKKIAILIGLLFIVNENYAQFTESDLKITITGLSEQYTKRFNENKKVFIESLNKQKLPISINPIKLDINYKNNQGSIQLTVNFECENIYSNVSDYYNHGILFQSMGKGISFIFQHQLMLAISEYEYAVAREGYSLKKDIADFNIILCLKKSNGDFIKIYAYNTIDKSDYGEIFKYDFNTQTDICLSGKIYKTECSNSNTLNNMKFYYLKDLEGLDGKKTGAYYFCKFFNISIE